MKKITIAALVCMVIGFILQTQSATADSAGEILFKQHCAACHPEGRNIINPQKTLQKKVLEANGVKSSDDIVKIMRNPGPGMSKFDEKTIPGKDARKIADYIINTFK
jgi:cytochrome c6